VAPNGDDGNPGTVQRPFATVQRARDAVRGLKREGGLPAGGVTVWLRQRTYYLSRPLELGKRDSGTAAAPITYSAYGTEKVWLSGGKALDPSLWKPVTDPAVQRRMDSRARGKVLQVDLATAGVPRDVAKLPDAFYDNTDNDPVLAELFCNGQRMQLARWPNTGFAKFGEVVEPGEESRSADHPERLARFKFEDDRLKRWNADGGVWMKGYWRYGWLCTSVRAGRIDKDKHEIELASPLHYGVGDGGGHRFYVFNLLEELDEPGEWFLDRKTSILYFWPPKPLAQCRTVVSSLSQPLVSIDGADHVIFHGIGFEEGRQNAVDMRDSSHDRLIACTIRNVGMDGVAIAGGQDDGVQGCDIHDTGFCGVRISGGDRTTLTPCNHIADNNHIYKTSVITRTHAGPLSLNGVGIQVSHNLIHHDPQTAIWYAGNDIVMEYNEIYYVLTETTEGGVFYTGRDWTYRGNTIRNNYIHHINDTIPGCGSEAVVVHLDDCVSGTSFVGNLCYLCGIGVSMCGGPDNTADNNLFIKCKTGVSVEGRGLEWWKWTKHPDGTVTTVDTRDGSTDNPLLDSLREVPYTKPPWTKYPHLADILERDPAGAPYFCRSTRNIAFDGGPVLSVEGSVKPEWITIKDNWDNQGDPGFVNATKGDFRLRPDAPVIKKIGFQPLPIKEMGLINDGTRATWPAAPEPPPPGFKPRWLRLQEEKQRFVVPSDMPVVAVPRAYGHIAIDGTVGSQEWAPTWAQRLPHAPRDPLPLAWNADGTASIRPSRGWVEADDQNLYVAFINDIDPTKGVSGGHTWGEDDAVEIALAPVRSQKVGGTVVLRGFADGHFVSSREAGVGETVATRALHGTQYACRVLGANRWTAEWKIPFAAIGVEPRKLNQRILFNLSVRKPADDLWVMWMKGTSTTTWEVREGGVLLLPPFRDMARGSSIGAHPERLGSGCLCQGPVKPAQHHAASRKAVTRVSGKSRRSIALGRVLAERSGRCHRSPWWITDGTAPPMVICPRHPL
jgi:hypothetical protein